MSVKQRKIFESFFVSRETFIKRWCLLLEEEKEVLKEEIKIINTLLEIIKEKNKERNIYDKNIITIIISIILAFTIIGSVFTVCYFFSDYSGEVEKENSNSNYNYNYNLNE